MAPAARRGPSRRRSWPPPGGPSGSWWWRTIPWSAPSSSGCWPPHGYLVTAVSHPQQALDLEREELSHLQLVVTDVVMPGMDGHTLAQELGLRNPGLPVLYLSGYTRDAISERGVTDSGAGFLAKPFSRAALLGKVRGLLDGVLGG